MCGSAFFSRLKFRESLCAKCKGPAQRTLLKTQGGHVNTARSQTCGVIENRRAVEQLAGTAAAISSFEVGLDLVKDQRELSKGFE